MARYLNEKQRAKESCRKRFAEADQLAFSVVGSLSIHRDMRRDALIADGADPTAVLAERVGGIRDMLTDMFNPSPMAGKVLSNEENPFDPEDPDAVPASWSVGVLKAAVWDLWRDYGEWPSREVLTDRLSTWLNVTKENARAVLTASYADPWLDQHFRIGAPIFGDGVYDTHDESRWYICDIAEAFFQEQMFQWRKLLDDDGVVYLVGLVSFADVNRNFWQLPA